MEVRGVLNLKLSLPVLQRLLQRNLLAPVSLHAGQGRLQQEALAGETMSLIHDSSNCSLNHL